MLIHGIQPSVSKTKPSLRDLIIKELEKHSPTELEESTPEPGILTRIYLSLQGFLGGLPFFRK
jgi:hypothetical protein